MLASVVLVPLPAMPMSRRDALLRSQPTGTCRWRSGSSRERHDDHRAVDTADERESPERARLTRMRHAAVWPRGGRGGELDTGTERLRPHRPWPGVAGLLVGLDDRLDEQVEIRLGVLVDGGHRARRRVLPEGRRRRFTGAADARLSVR